MNCVVYQYVSENRHVGGSPSALLEGAFSSAFAASYRCWEGLRRSPVATRVAGLRQG